ncbi:MAG: T9SS type A sorting domain-containing protein [Bacteroidota bacterium]
MKKLLLLATGILFLFNNVSAQVVADAGPDLQPCTSTPFTLGGSPTASGGSGNYSYSWEAVPVNLLFQSGQPTTLANPTFCCTNSYWTFRVTVHDNTSGAEASDTVNVDFVYPPYISSINVSDTLACPSTVLSFSATTSYPPVAYQWNFNDGTSISTIDSPNHVYNLGNYFVTLTTTGVMGCTTSLSSPIIRIIPSCLGLTLSKTNVTCFGSCNGSATVNPAGNYNYLWSNNATTATVTGLCTGTYSVTVMDSVLNPIDTLSTTITQPALLTVSGSATNAACAGVNDGRIIISSSGGTNPYTYSWTNGSTSRNLSSLAPGIYTVTVTDSNACTVTAGFTISANPLMTVTTTNTHITCQNTDTTVLTIINGKPRFYISWGDGSFSSDFDSVYSHSYSTGGVYILQVSDTNGCSVTITDTILNLLGYSYYIYASGTDANCASDGTVTASVHGGVPPFTYLWNNSATTPALTGISAGTYTLTVVGSDGCYRTATAQVDSVCYNIIQGYLFVDSNNNCIRDNGETAVVSRSLTASNGSNTYYGYADGNGYYEINVASPGNFTLNSHNGWGNQCITGTICGPQTITFTGVGDTAVVNFGFSATSNFNLGLHPGWHAANPGFTKDYWVLYNQTSQPIYTGPATITFRYDTILIYQSNNNSGVHNAAAHTITWTVSSVPYPSWNWNTVPRANFTVPANTPVGYQLSQEFWITPTAGDCDTSNNHLLVIQPVTGSLDPNEKEVLPAGNIVEEDSVLTYTIHFQNTGNDTTWFVILKDTLSPHLNAATVQNLSSSHEYSSFDISDNGILTWLFNPIFLVDSATNEPASKGYVMFKVKKKAGLPLTTQISNKASIYFDYNEPIVTNTVTNTLTEPNFVFTVRGDENISVTAMPNPFTQQTQIVVDGINSNFDFELFDVTGKVIRKISQVTDNRFELQREDMSAGVYFYRITTTQKQRAFGRVVVE